MTREQVVRLTVLTACIFAFSMYMQKGTWIFPFPLYEAGMFAAIIALYIAERKKPDVLAIIAGIWALLQLFSSDFMLEFLVKAENWQQFDESLTSDYLLLGFAAFFLLWGILVLLKVKKLSLKIISMVSCFTFFGIFVFNFWFAYWYLWAMIPLIVWLVCLFMDEGKEASIHRNILFLFTFFFLSKYLTLALLAN